MNVLVMGGRVIGEEVAHEVARAFLKAKFTHNERHIRRPAKVQAIERRYLQKNSGKARAKRADPTSR